MKYLVCILLLPLAARAADKDIRLKIVKAEGYLTPTLMESSCNMMEKASLTPGYNFLVTRVVYKVLLKKDQSLRLGGHLMMIQADPDGAMVQNIGTMKSTGAARFVTSGRISHSRPSDDIFSTVLIYPVPATAKAFTLKYKYAAPTKLVLRPQLRDEIEGKNGTPPKVIETCTVEGATALERFIYPVGGYPHNTHRGTVRASKIDQMVEFELRFRPVEDLEWLTLDDDALAFRCRENGVLYEYMYTYNQISQIEFRRKPDKHWSAKGSPRTLYAKLPGFCKEFDVVCMGRTIGSGKITKRKKQND